MFGCSLARSEVRLPVDNSITREQLVIYSDFQLARHHRLVEELVAQRGDVTNLLQLPISDEPIHVHLFESARSYRNFIGQHYPEFPDRRAFFVEDDTRLSIYAHWGNRVAEDLRHEVAHGYLHAVLPNLQLWVDEGLAEYFEVARGHNGVNAPHVRMLLDADRSGAWQPDPRRLDMLENSNSMTQEDYAEAWAWVHWLLQSEPRRHELMRNHLARLRMTGTATPLGKIILQAEPDAPQQLREHLRSLAL
jgi:hypothetical protein